MRRGSFGGSYGMGRNAAGAGGAGSGGGGILRTVKRAVKRGAFNESIKSPTTNTAQKPAGASTQPLSISSSSSSGPRVSSSSSTAAWPPLSYFPPTDFGEFDQWEYVEDYEDDGFVVGNGDGDGDVPSVHEVQHAVFSLQEGVIQQIPTSRLTNLDQMHFNVMQNESSMSSDSDWIEPSMPVYSPRFPVSSGFERVYDALNLLQTEPTIQRMVVSLSSDKAVWDAVMNNEAVREIRESYNNAQPNPQISDESSDCVDTNPSVLKWMLDNMKAKFLEVIESISQSLAEIFKPLDQEQTEQSDTFSEKLKSAFLLSVVVLLIVVISRGHTA